jgi:hypothetical protein
LKEHPVAKHQVQLLDYRKREVAQVDYCLEEQGMHCRYD